MTIERPATAAGADAELIALGKQLEPLVDAYYAAPETNFRRLYEEWLAR